MNHRIMALCPQHIYVTFCDQYEVLATAAVATPVFGHSLLNYVSKPPDSVYQERCDRWACTSPHLLILSSPC